LQRWTGAALACGGALTLLLNACLTPFMPHAEPFVQTAASGIFLWRESLSGLAAALLLVGATGLYWSQADRAGWFGAVAFTMALLGTALLLAWEWVDLFILRDLALRAPSTLQMLESTKGPSLYEFGALIPLGLFTLGWIALATSTVRAEPSLRRGAGLLIAGFVATPVLGASLGPLVGGILGSGLMGLGWISLGMGVRGAAGRDVLRPITPWAHSSRSAPGTSP
jgi:hypothetical protein